MADTPIDDREYGVADNSDEWEAPANELPALMNDIRETFVPCKCSKCLFAASELRIAQPETD